MKSDYKMSDAPTRLLHFSLVKQEYMLSERKQEEEEKMVSNDDDNFRCDRPRGGMWVAHLDLLPKKNPHGVFRALPPRWKTMPTLWATFA